MEKVYGIFRKNWHYAAGGIAGGIGGYLYWYNVGCSTGACPITSSPIMSTIWGALMGGLLLDLIFSKKKQSSKQ